MEYYIILYYIVKDKKWWQIECQPGCLKWLNAPHPSLRYDSLTGVPSFQRTLAFEKGSVLFNIGALYTQIGARQDRSVRAGIDTAIDSFQRAAGTMTEADVRCPSDKHVVDVSTLWKRIRATFNKTALGIDFNVNSDFFFLWEFWERF